MGNDKKEVSSPSNNVTMDPNLRAILDAMQKQNERHVAALGSVITDDVSSIRSQATAIKKNEKSEFTEDAQCKCANSTSSC